MQVLRTDDHGSSRMVAVIGRGLLGRSIIRALKNQGYMDGLRLDISWDEPGLRHQQFSKLFAALDGAANGNKTEVHVVWSAGNGSFSSAREELQDEHAAFVDMLGVFRSLLARFPTALHFVSSAGGLHEGQVLVDDGRSVNPKRPYADMKLDQERLLEEFQDGSGCRIRIYRPSTVYGPHEFNKRAGLVSHLLWNTLRNAPTTLETHLHALRDFVWVDDLGRYIAHKVGSGFEDPRRIFYLVSGKPSSIYEVVRRIERMTGRSIIYQFSNKRRNDADITFSPLMLPDDWYTTNLDQGLRMVLIKTVDAYLRDTRFD